METSKPELWARTWFLNCLKTTLLDDSVFDLSIVDCASFNRALVRRKSFLNLKNSITNWTTTTITSSVARAGCNGAFAPPPSNLDCFAVDKIEFWLVIHRNVKLKGFFWQLHPQSKFLATALTTTQKWSHLRLGGETLCTENSSEDFLSTDHACPHPSGQPCFLTCIF